MGDTFVETSSGYSPTNCALSKVKTKIHSGIKKMVKTFSHLGVGFLIALALGFKGKKRNILAFLVNPP